MARPEMRLMVAAMMTAPSGKEIHAWRRAVRRMCLVYRSVSDTWNVIPMVKAG